MKYPSRSTKQIVESVQRRRGFDPTQPGFTVQELERIVELVNDALRYAWSRSLWPQLLQTVRTQYRESWSESEEFSEGEQCLHNGFYWESTCDDNTGNEPSEDSAKWRICNDTMVCSIDFDSLGIDEVDLQNGVFLRNPERVKDAYPLSCERAPWGLNVVDKVFVERPYVRYRPKCPTLTYVPWSATTQYRIGDRVLGSDGESYVAMAPSENVNPASDASGKWLVQLVPSMFESFVIARAAAAYAQDDDGRRREMADAEQLLVSMISNYSSQIRERHRISVRAMQ